MQISKAFTTQYYNVLHKQPADVHKFYRDGSRLSRADGLASPLDSASTVAVCGGHARLLSHCLMSGMVSDA